MKARQRRIALYKSALEWIETLVWASVAVVLLFTFVGRTTTVSGDSMNPNYLNGDRLIVSGLGYRPAGGDVVVFSPNEAGEDNLIKRIIAIEGQTVDIDFARGVVWVDGVALDEPYAAEPTYVGEGTAFPATVPAGHVFVLGDNRNHSRDSRSPSVGMVDTRKILGRVLLRFYPLAGFGRPV